MLKSLLIKNFILIEEAFLKFSEGFNILCGETGAGKSIIIKALDGVLGAKISKEVILNKEKPALIEAVFEINGQEITISREINTQSKFRLNGILSNIEEIKEKRERLVDIHSQHQTYAYMSPKNHITLLDDYICKKSPEFKEILKSYKETYLDFKEVEKKLNYLKENLQNNQKEIDFLSFQLKELDDAEIKTNEEDEIKAELDILTNAQELKEKTYGAYWALYGDNQNIIEGLSKIKYEISNCAGLDKNLTTSEETLFDALENLKDCANYLKDYSSNLEFNPLRLDELNERLSLIQKLKRKYGENLEEERDKIEKQLNELTSNDNNLEIIEENYNTLLTSINLLSKKLNEYRNINAKELSKAIVGELKSLKLNEAKFEIMIKETTKGEKGSDNVEFLISTNKNQTLSPLVKIASGGEISRVMLAMKIIFANIDKVSTVVFDEIDTGISGITSNAVKDSLMKLSKTTQIICISHQPIICAKADNFIWISKTHNENTNIKVEILNEKERLKAIAQLASGQVNDETVEFAKTLI